jgi:hypothetical protein
VHRVCEWLAGWLAGWLSEGVWLLCRCCGMSCQPTEEIALPTHKEGPADMPLIAFTYELDGKINLTAFDQEVPIPYPSAHVGAGYPNAPDNMTRSLRKGYYAAVSFTDFLIGELLAELEVLGKHKDTIVALIGDHGWQLGTAYTAYIHLKALLSCSCGN